MFLVNIHRKASSCSANAIFGKVRRIASVLQLISQQSVPSLLYGLEACLVVKF